MRNRCTIYYYCARGHIRTCHSTFCVEVPLLNMILIIWHSGRLICIVFNKHTPMVFYDVFVSLIYLRPCFTIARNKTNRRLLPIDILISYIIIITNTIIIIIIINFVTTTLLLLLLLYYTTSLSISRCFPPPISFITIGWMCNDRTTRSVATEWWGRACWRYYKNGPQPENKYYNTNSSNSFTRSFLVR